MGMIGRRQHEVRTTGAGWGPTVLVVALAAGLTTLMPTGAGAGVRFAGDPLEPTGGVAVTIAADVVDPDDDGISLREAALASSETTGEFVIQLTPGATYELTDCTGDGRGSIAFEGADVTLLGSADHPPTIVQTCPWDLPYGLIPPSLEARSGVALTVEDVHLHAGRVHSTAGPGGRLVLRDVEVAGVVGNTSTHISSGVASDAPTVLERTTVTGGRLARGVTVTDGATLEVVESTIADNQSGEADGGGIWSTGAVAIERSTVSANGSGGSGGGAFLANELGSDAVHVVTDSTLSGNRALQGSAIYVGAFDGESGLRLHRSTVADNVSTGSGGALRFEAAGADTSAGGHIDRSTFAGNRTEGVPGLAEALDLSQAATGGAFSGIDLERSVLGSTDELTPTCAASGDAVLESWWGEGGNVTVDDSCGDVGARPLDRADVGDVDLRPLADNGGPTLTMLPERGSPVIDVVPEGVEACGTVEDHDQRGVPRPWGDGCDAGAVEVDRSDCATTGLVDVGADHRFCAAIGWAWWTAIVDGYDDGTFRPTASVSRQAVAVFLARRAGVGVTGPPCPTAPFPDVAASHRFCGPIGWVAEEGIAAGYDDGLFRPTAPVSRQAAVTFLARAEGLDPATLPCAGDVFGDVAPGHRFCGAIEWAAAEGLTSGYDDGTFRPTAPVSRQAAAAFLHRLAVTES